MHKSNFWYKIVVIIFSVVQLSYFFGIKVPTIITADATNFQTAYVTLSNSRFSYRGVVNANTSAGATSVTVSSSGNSDNDTNNIFPNDTVCFNNPASNGCADQTAYTVNTVPTTTSFTTTSGITSALTGGTNIVSTQSAQLTIYFKPTTALSSGNHLLLSIPAASSNYSDGMPDSTGFDWNKLPAGDIYNAGSCTTNTCITTTGSPNAWTISAASLSFAGATTTNDIDITISSTLNAGTAYQFVLGGSAKSLQFILPSPSGTTHVRGQSDSYSVTLQSKSGSTVLDKTIMKVNPIDGVLVSANVELALTYTINDASNGYSGNIANGQTVSQCNYDGGHTFLTTAASTATSIPFGSISSFNTFFNVAQTHYIQTNATNGYSLTVQEDGDMSLNGGGVTTIPKTSCDSGPCTSSSAQPWNTQTNNGLGYTLGNITGTDAVNTALATTGYRQLSTSATTIMSNAGATSGSRIATCYRLSVGSAQQTGTYFNKITYVATPKF